MGIPAQRSRRLAPRVCSPSVWALRSLHVCGAHVARSLCRCVALRTACVGVRSGHPHLRSPFVATARVCTTLQDVVATCSTRAPGGATTIRVRFSRLEGDTTDGPLGGEIADRAKSFRGRAGVFLSIPLGLSARSCGSAPPVTSPTRLRQSLPDGCSGSDSDDNNRDEDCDRDRE